MSGSRLQHDLTEVVKLSICLPIDRMGDLVITSGIQSGFLEYEAN